MDLSTMLYGATLSALLAGTLVALTAGPHRVATTLVAVAAAFLGPLAWNSVLRSTEATGAFSHDAPFPPMPISWQDTGSGITTLALAALLLGLGPLQASGRRTSTVALLPATAALLIDIYLY